MGDRPLDDTKPHAPAPRPEREPGAYYYDDQTNYEPYDPSLEEDEADEEDGEGDDARDAEKATGDRD